MEPQRDGPDGKRSSRELADALIAVSVVSRRLASRIAAGARPKKAKKKEKRKEKGKAMKQ